MTMEALDTPFRNHTIGEIASTLPGATGVFRKYRLDFCCGGNDKLSVAAAKRGVDVTKVERALIGLDQDNGKSPLSEETSDLVDHILTRYHEVHRRELPELIKLARKVEAVHANNPNVPHGLAVLLQDISDELDSHMQKEEMILFPAMLQQATGMMDGPIEQMRHEHDQVGEKLQVLEDITGGFNPPSDACGSWRALYVGAAKFADDLMEHVHLENNVLFPRFSEEHASR